MNAGISTIQSILLSCGIAVCLGLTVADRAAAQTDLNRLTAEYQAQRQHRVRDYHQQRDGLRFGYEAELDRLRLAQVNAERLCGQARAAAIQQIAWQRREAVERYHVQVRALDRQHVQTLQQLDAWYRDASRALVTYRPTPAPHFSHPTGPLDSCPHGGPPGGFSFSIGRRGWRIGVTSGGGSYLW